MRGSRKGRVHSRAVILDPTPIVADVIGNLVMHPVGTVSHCGGHIDDGGQFFEDRLQRLDPGLRLFQRLGDDGGIGVADMTDLAMRQHRAFGFLHGRAIAGIDQPTCGVPPHGREIGTSKHGQHAGHRLGRRRVNRHDPRMRHVRPGKGGKGLAVQLNVGGILAASGQKPHILAPLAAGADAGLDDCAILGHLHSPPREGWVETHLTFIWRNVGLDPHFGLISALGRARG